MARKLVVYAARGMTSRIKEEVVEEARRDKEFLEKAGFIVRCPVSEEGVKPTKQVLLSSKKAMDSFWPRDCEMMRQSDIIFDCTAHLNSEGTKHEIAKSRYHYWKPVVRIFPEGKMPVASSISYYEDDAVVDSLIEAVEWSLRVYGTPWKRLKWKLGILNRCFLKFLGVRFMWFFDWI